MSFLGKITGKKNGEKKEGEEEEGDKKDGEGEEEEDAGADLVELEEEAEGADGVPTAVRLIEDLIERSDDFELKESYEKQRPWQLTVKNINVLNLSSEAMTPFMVMKLEVQDATIPCHPAIQAQCRSRCSAESDAEFMAVLEVTNAFDGLEAGAENPLGGKYSMQSLGSMDGRLNLSYRDLATHMLDLELWNYNKLGANKFLGNLRRSLQQDLRGGRFPDYYGVTEL